MQAANIYDILLSIASYHTTLLHRRTDTASKEVPAKCEGNDLHHEMIETCVSIKLG
jgi:hypothetical protein